MNTAYEYMHTQYNTVFTIKRARTVKKLLIFKLLMNKIMLCFPRKKISSSEIVPKLIEIEHQLWVNILGNYRFPLKKIIQRLLIFFCGEVLYQSINQKYLKVSINSCYISWECFMLFFLWNF